LIFAEMAGGPAAIPAYFISHLRASRSSTSSPGNLRLIADPATAPETTHDTARAPAICRIQQLHGLRLESIEKIERGLDGMLFLFCSASFSNSSFKLQRQDRIGGQTNPLN